MKKVIEDLAAKRNIFTSYSGTLRIMYLSGENVREFIVAMREKYPNLAFQLKNQTDVDAAKTKEKSLSGVKEVYDKLPPEQKITKQLNAIATEQEKESIGEQGMLDPLPATKEQVDEYLINNPIDRSEKNPYNRTAQVLRVKPDYVRGRWRALREKGLVEKESETVNT